MPHIMQASIDLAFVLLAQTLTIEFVCSLQFIEVKQRFTLAECSKQRRFAEFFNVQKQSKASAYFVETAQSFLHAGFRFCFLNQDLG